MESIFPNYIYDKILIFIINYITLHKRYIKGSFPRFSTNQYFNNNEIIQYSLVSRRFFKFISDTLSINFKLKNFKILYRLINKNNQYSSQYNNQNNKYKLIQKHQNKKNIYQSLTLFENDLYINNSINSNKNYIIINKRIEDIKKLLNKIKDYPSNCKFIIKIEPLKLLELNNLVINLINKENDETEREINIYNKIYKIEISGDVNYQSFYFENLNNMKIYNNLLNQILSLKPKKFKLDIKSIKFPLDFSNLFQYKNSISNYITSINIGHSNHVDLKNFNEINNKETKLKKVSFYLLFHDIIRIFNNNNFRYYVYDDQEDEEFQQTQGICQNYQSTTQNYNDLNSILDKDWNQFIEILSTNSTIQKFSLRDYCVMLNCLGESDFDFIDDSLSRIFNSKFSKITTLVLEGCDFIESQLLQSLKSNTNIINLDLYHLNPEPFFKEVLLENKVIKNLIVWYYRQNDCFNTIQKYIDKVHLYSISVYVYKEYFKDYLQFLNNPSNKINVKEFNIYISDKLIIDNPYSRIPVNQYKHINNINNNFILQIYNIKKQ